MRKWIKKLWKRLRPKKHITMAELLKSPMIDSLPQCGPITEHMVPWKRIKNYAAIYEPKPKPNPWLGVDERLPRRCPLCNGLCTPSKVDDRMVACFACKEVYMSQEAFADPNIQRDITHAQAGIRCSGRNDFNDRDECEEDDNENA